MNIKRYDSGVTPILCAHLAARGLIDAQIAELLRVPEGTFKRWRHERAELREAMQQAKGFIDSLVEGSLLKRALGYDIVEVTRESVPVRTDPITGKVTFAMRATKKVTKHIAGEVGAQAFWLKNRQGWRDHSSLEVEHSGSIDLYAMDASARQARIQELLTKRVQEVAGKN